MVRIIVIEVVYNNFCMTTNLFLVAQVWGISVCEIVGFVSASFHVYMYSGPILALLNGIKWKTCNL